MEGNPEEVTIEEEARRRERLLDQMASMHSILRDRAEFRGQVLGFVLISSSFLLLVLSLASDQLLSGVGLNPTVARPAVTIASVAVFVVTLAELRLGYGLRAAGHREAARRLADLKIRYGVELAGAISAPRIAKLESEYQLVCSVIPAIPEGQFNDLKMAHLRKKRLSKLVDLFPNVPLWWLRLRLLREDLGAPNRPRSP